MKSILLAFALFSRLAVAGDLPLVVTFPDGSNPPFQIPTDDDVVVSVPSGAGNLVVTVPAGPGLVVTFPNQGRPSFQIPDDAGLVVTIPSGNSGLVVTIPTGTGLTVSIPSGGLVVTFPSGNRPPVTIPIGVSTTISFPVSTPAAIQFPVLFAGVFVKFPKKPALRPILLPPTKRLGMKMAVPARKSRINPVSPGRN